MATVKAKIVSISASTANSPVKVLVSFKDKSFEWSKTYALSNTEKVKLSDFKKRVESDIQKDLKPQSQLSELEAVVGQEFNISV